MLIFQSLTCSFEAIDLHTLHLKVNEGEMMFSVEDADLVKTGFQNLLDSQVNHHKVLEDFLDSNGDNDTKRDSAINGEVQSSVRAEHAVHTPFGLGMLQEGPTAKRQDNMAVVYLEWGAVAFLPGTQVKAIFPTQKKVVDRHARLEDIKRKANRSRRFYHLE